MEVSSSIADSRPRGPVKDGERAERVLIRFREAGFFVHHYLGRAIILDAGPCRPFLVLRSSRRVPRVKVGLFGSFLASVVATGSFIRTCPRSSIQIFVRFSRHDIQFRLPIRVGGVRRVRLRALANRAVGRSVRVFYRPGAIVGAYSDRLSSIVRERQGGLKGVQVSFRFVLLRIVWRRPNSFLRRPRRAISIVARDRCDQATICSIHRDKRNVVLNRVVRRVCGRAEAIGNQRP